MPMLVQNKALSLFCVIVNFGEGSKVLKAARELGVTGGTFLLGTGTIKNSILNLLGLDEVRREILLMVIEESLEESLNEYLAQKFHFDKPNHGITFSIPISSLAVLNGNEYISKPRMRGADEMQYEAIFTIVDKGLSDDVMEAAQSAGATGGTVIHGRGAGSHDTAKLFNIEIEPEKDIILILAESEKTAPIVNAIKERMDIEEPGKGVIFVVDVNRTYGLYKGNK